MTEVVGGMTVFNNTCIIQYMYTAPDNRAQGSMHVAVRHLRHDARRLRCRSRGRFKNGGVDPHGLCSWTLSCAYAGMNITPNDHLQRASLSKPNTDPIFYNFSQLHRPDSEPRFRHGRARSRS